MYFTCDCVLESASESEPAFHVVTDSSHARLCTQGPAGCADWNLLLAVMVLLNAISVFFFVFLHPNPSVATAALHLHFSLRGRMCCVHSKA